MPKMKTSRAAAKRFKKTGSGKLKRNKAYKSHILTKKSQKRKKKFKKSRNDRCKANVKNRRRFCLFLIVYRRK